MKQFNNSLVRVKDKNKKFIPLDAIRGESIYDIAVRYGYVGSEEDLIREIMTDGWVTRCQRLEDEKASVEYVSDYVDNALTSVSLDWKILADDTFDLEWPMIYGNTEPHVSERIVNLSDDLRNYKEFYILYSPGVSDQYTGTTTTVLVPYISIDDSWYSLDYINHSHSSSEPDNAFVASSVRQILTLPDGSCIISPCMGHRDNDTSDYKYNQVCVPATYNDIRVMRCDVCHNLTSASIQGLRIIVVAR